MAGGPIVRALQLVVAMVIILLISLTVIETMQGAIEEEDLEEFQRYEIYRPYIFDINDLIVNPEDENVFNSTELTEYYAGSDSVFCHDLRACIETNIKAQRFCVIEYKVSPPNVNLNINALRNAIAACPEVNIVDELYGGTKRMICKFEPITKYNEMREDNLTLLEYEPYIHNCYIPENLGSFNVMGDVDSVNYIYSGRGNSLGYSFENGGTVRIAVTNVSVREDYDATCSYSVYVCGQNAIAAYSNETPVDVFNKVRNMDESNLYFNDTVYWGNPKPSSVTDYGWYLIWMINFILGNAPEPPRPRNVYGYYPSYYEFNFSSSMPDEHLALVDSIDAGMWEWSKINHNNIEFAESFISEFKTMPQLHYTYSPIENIVQDSTISFASGCWNSNYETIDDRNEYEERVGVYIQAPSFMNSQSLESYFNFNSFNIGDRIKMTLGIKKIFLTDKEKTIKQTIIPWLWEPEITTSVVETLNNVFDPDIEAQAILVLDPVTICSE